MVVTGDSADIPESEVSSAQMGPCRRRGLEGARGRANLELTADRLFGVVAIVVNTIVDLDDRVDPAAASAVAGCCFHTSGAASVGTCSVTRPELERPNNLRLGGGRGS
jgi:hypothetical protein